jgi:anaerobic ribonucleoside-triphosphate reductase activating protein
VYSGYAYDTIRDWVASEPGLIDALISEPYLESMPQTLALRGSDNQKLHLLTALGAERFAGYDRTLQTADRRFDVMFDPDGTVWLAGIPTRVDFERFRRAVETSGNSMVLSASPSGEVPA